MCLEGTSAGGNRPDFHRPAVQSNEVTPTNTTLGILLAELATTDSKAEVTVVYTSQQHSNAIAAGKQYLPVT